MGENGLLRSLNKLILCGTWFIHGLYLEEAAEMNFIVAKENTYSAQASSLSIINN